MFFVFMHHVEKNCECLVPVQGGLIHVYCTYLLSLNLLLPSLNKNLYKKKCFVNLMKNH